MIAHRALALLAAVGLASSTACDDSTCHIASDCESDQLCRTGECVPRPPPTPPKPRTVPPVWPDRSTGFLWQIEGTPPTYLLGTIHVGVDPAGFPEALFSAFDSSKLVAIEADIREPIDQATIDMYSQLPPELSLQDLFPPDVWPLLVAELAPFFTEVELRRLEPWFASLFIGSGGSDLPTMEPRLIERALARGQPLGFLETAADQFSAIDQTPREYWVDEIAAALRDPDQASLDFDALVNAYLQADAAAILDPPLDPGVAEFLLYARNQSWIPQIEAWHRDGGAFVAVGVGHMLGPGSVIELLRTRGSTVSEVRLDGMALRQPIGEVSQEPLALPDVPRPDLTFPLF
jgi:uncharacterized protein